jgi:Zn-dependent metalloprotease
MKPKLFIPLLLSILTVNICFSQIYRGSEANQRINSTDLVKFKDYTKVPNYFRFSENTTHSEQDAIDIVKSFIKNNNSDLQLKIAQKQGDGNYTLRYVQTVNGFPIEFSALNLQLKDIKITEVNGEILDNPRIIPNFVISEETALQFALNYVNAQQYMWDDDDEYLPTGEKVIVPDKIDFDKSILKSAYKFNIYSKNPHNRQMIYVDAENGEIILDLPLIHFNNVVGTAQTAYYGVREINTDYTGTQYTLYDATRGNGIHTYNCNNTGQWLNNYYTNSTTTWNSTPYGTDAHFSTAATYDYFFQKHGYNSINNAGFALKSYVNFNLMQIGYGNNINAFWNGSCMTYGNGNPPSVTALTTIDICGHEITHGLTSFTANLVYSYESGALSEGFSDIFGTAIEFFAVPEVANWTMGEKMGLIIRSVSNPKAYNLPDTYKGQNWYSGSGDNGGVHYNCGPLSFWFYLLCVGKSGTNDYGNSYNVSPIGMSKAEKIAFKMLAQYLTPNSNYADACFYGLQAAVALYGECSDEVKAVGDAFYAIGVLSQPYNNQATANFKANITQSCSTPLTVQFSNQSSNCNTFTWDFGDGSPTSSQMNPTHIYTANGSYTVTLTGSGDGCGTDTKIKQNYINISSELSNHEFKIYDTLAFELFIPEGSENLRWYDHYEENLWETTPLFVGNPIQHDGILEDKTYYILDGYEDYEDYVGEKVCNANGGFFTSTEVHYLVFDACQDFVLKSVLVNANSAGNRVITLKNSSGGVIWTKTVNIPAGPSRITIDKEVLAGTNLQLCGPSTPGLYRSQSANLSYPYKIEDVVSIKYSSASSDIYGYYYYFYDWEIAIPGCHSGLGTVNLITGEDPPILGGTVTIDGEAVFGEILTANTTELTCEPEEPLGVLSFIWKRDDTQVGANSSTYTTMLEDIGKKISVTVTAKNCTGAVNSESTEPVTKAPQSEPEAPELDSVTATSITLVIIEGCEYRMDGGEWQTSPVFSELTPDSPYSFTQRFAETATHYASPESMSAVFITDKEVGIGKITNYELRIYPNPTTGELRVTSDKLQVTGIEVFDIYGRKQKAESRKQNAVDISSLSAGIYFVKIETENGVVVKKVVKM